MTDSIYYGNILGLLKTGKWSLNLREAEAVVALAIETEKRLNPKVEVTNPEPIKKVKKSAK